MVQDCDTLLEIRDTPLRSPELDCEALIDIRDFIGGKTRDLPCGQFRLVRRKP